jgi:hypothetical protein
MSSVCWSRLIRYKTEQDGSTRYGDAGATPKSVDLGQLAEQGALFVRPLHVGVLGPLDESVAFASTDKENVEKVHTLLSPLAERDIPLFRCIGLNYKTHSKSMNVSPSLVHAGIDAVQSLQFLRLDDHFLLILRSSSSHPHAQQTTEMMCPSRNALKILLKPITKENYASSLARLVET